VAVAADLGIDPTIVNYRSRPPSADELRAIIAKLDDPPTALVRRDALFDKLGLTEADVATTDQIVDVIVNNKMLMQRPLLVTDDKAIIGRPKERVREFLS
jgi:arsenate reductase (glutaredoxin)